MNGLTKYEQLLHRHLSLRRALQDRGIEVEKDDNNQWSIDLSNVKGVGKPQAVTVYAFDFVGRPLGSFTTDDFKSNHALPRDTYSVQFNFADVTKREICEAFAVEMNYGDGRPPQRYGIDYAAPKRYVPLDICDGKAHSLTVNVCAGKANVELNGVWHTRETTGLFAHLLRALVAAIVAPSPAKVD